MSRNVDDMTTKIIVDEQRRAMLSFIQLYLRWCSE